MVFSPKDRFSVPVTRVAVVGFRDRAKFVGVAVVTN